MEVAKVARFAGGLLIGVMTACVLVSGLLWWGQEFLLFHPAAGPFPPASAARLTGFSPAWMDVDGHRVGFLLAPPREGMPVVLLFHGNAGTAADAGWTMEGYVQEGWGVVLAEYSGWTGNPGGPPGEVSMRRDGLAYADWVLHEYPRSPLFVWGDSIGTGIAVGVAAGRPVAALVLDSPYTSVLEMARRSYPWLPVDLMLRHPLDTMALLPRVSAPVMVVNGEADSIIPSDMGHTVWAALRVRGPGMFFPGIDHLPTFQGNKEGQEARDGIRAFLDSVREGRFREDRTSEVRQAPVAPW